MPNQPQQPSNPPEPTQPATPPPPPPTPPHGADWTTYGRVPDVPRVPHAPRPAGERPPLGWIAAVIGLLVVCAVCAGVLHAIQGANIGSGSDTTTQQQVDVATATALPTPRPTATVTATPDPVQQVIDRATSYGQEVAGGLFEHISATYDGQVLTVTVTVGEQFDLGVAQDNVKSICFDLQQAYWLHGHWHAPISEIDLGVFGPVQDQYGNVSTGKYGECDLTAQTEKLFNWPNLYPDTAWGAYDVTYLRQK